MFQTELQGAEQEVGSLARLCCQLSEVEPGVPVQWFKEGVELHSGPKYEMHHQGAMCELLIHLLEAKDSGEYACVVGGQKTMASVKVRGEPSSNSCPMTRSVQVLFQGGSQVPSVTSSLFSFLYHSPVDSGKIKAVACGRYPA